MLALLHIYLDESGSAAPATRTATTRYFVLGAALVPDREMVEQAIQELRERQQFYHEFKSHKTPVRIRIELLRLAVSLGLSFDIIVVDKEGLSGEWQGRSGLELYEAMAGELLATVTREATHAILIVDEVDRRQTDVLRKSIKATVSPRRVRKVSGHDSRRDDLLQLADVVVGAVFRFKERGDSRCFEVIRSRIRWHRFSGEK